MGPLGLDGDFAFDGGVALVVFEGGVAPFPVEEAVIALKGQGGGWEGGAVELFFELGEVVGVDVRVAQKANQFARFQAALFGDEFEEEGVGGYVEGNAEKDVARTLIPEQVDNAVVAKQLIGIVTGDEGHFVKLLRIPGIDQDAAAFGIRFQQKNGPLQLVNPAGESGGPGGIVSVKVAPLKAVDGPQIGFGGHGRLRCFIMAIGDFDGTAPFVPDVAAALLKPAFVGDAFDEAFEFDADGFPGHLFGGEEGEPLGHGVIDHTATDRKGVDSGAVALFSALFEHLFHDGFIYVVYIHAVTNPF
jgi:hypothetical protein